MKYDYLEGSEYALSMQDKFINGFELQNEDIVAIS